MQYEKLCLAYENVQQTSKRLEKTRILAQLLRESNQDLRRVTHLLQGRVQAAWQKETMGVSAKIMIKLLCQVTGRNSKEIHQALRKTGDLGMVAEQMSSTKNQQTLFAKTLSVKYVYEQLRTLSSIEGVGSTGQKMKIISELLSHAQPQEAKYITRTVLEDLRIGIASGTLRDAIIYAFLSKEAGIEEEEIINREAYKHVSQAVQSAYDKTNDFSEVAVNAKKGLEHVQQVRIQLGVPLKVMLGVRGELTDAFEKLGEEILLQYKYDGFRVEIHKQEDKITIFTRRLENVTKQFPDIVEAVRENVTCKECILDAEAIGVDAETKKYKPFQEISQRIRRKYAISETAKKLPVDVRVFDILYKDKEELLETPLSKRQEILEETITEQELFGVAQTTIVATLQEANEFFTQAKTAGTEGLFAKKLDSTYQPGTRVGNWMKIKDTMEPLDVVIIGAEWGEGKRKGWLTSFEVAIMDEEGALLAIGKVGTGLKELPEEGFSYPEITELLEEHVISEENNAVTIKPTIVVEVAYEEIQKSPSYASGYALRFPRILRNRTEERSVEDITPLSYVEELYNNQNS